MIRDPEEGWGWVTIAAAIGELVLLVIAAALFIAITAVSQP